MSATPCTINAGFQPLFWIGLPTLLVFVGSRWFRFLVFGPGARLEQTTYKAIENRFSQRSYGSFVSWNSWVLALLQAVRNLALTLSWLFYILRPTTLATITNTFVAVNSLVFAGTVLYQASEAFFWQAGYFGIALAFRTLEALVFIASLILVAIELAAIPTGGCTGPVTALLIVLIVVVVHEVFLLWPRFYFFYANHKKEDTSNQGRLEDRILPTAAQANPLMQPLGRSRASTAAFQKNY